MDRQARIFGVRHLSPGGAWHLERFIQEVQPTAILVEGPADANDLLTHLGRLETRPPVALLAFTRARPVRSLLYPLALYSPEWVAIQAGLQQKRLLRFMDLPAATFLALQDEELKTAQQPDEEGKAASSAAQAYLDDPWQEIARIAGHPDHETWWERQFEHTAAPDAYRAAIHEFGSGLRELRRDEPRLEAETELREAYMRRVIQETIAAGHDPERILVVCGAYHASALVADLPAMTDAEIRKLPSTKTTLTLMPYSYFRLSSQSGYGAGNHAPRYYQMLWESRSGTYQRGLPARYMSELASWLRQAGTVRSSAEVIEAVRLAEALAALKEASAPTLRDLWDAATTCLGGGQPAVLNRARQEVEIGDAVGTVPPGVARTSLQDDFYFQAEALKLQEYLKDADQPIKGRSGEPWLDRRLDRFRTTEAAAARDRNRSIFLHRLELLGIPFAQNVTSPEDRAISTYKECWTARWTPECEISLAESSLRGDTVAQAAVAALREKLESVAAVGEAAALARQAVDCDLAAGMELALRRVQELAVDDSDLASIAGAVFELAALVRYKEVSNIDVRPLRPLVAQLFLRASLLVHQACRCDAQAARAAAQALEQVHFVAFLPAGDDTVELPLERWVTALDAVAEDDGCNPLLSGVATALLLERGRLADEALEQRVGRRLSPGAAAEAGAGFFEGLASRNRHALLARRQLWVSLTGFLEGLEPQAFLRVLPGLRRAFSAFSTGEARRVVAVLAEVWGSGMGPVSQAVEEPLDSAEVAALAEALGGLDLEL